MSRIKRKSLALLAAMVAVVALLGASLGMAVAGTASLGTGFNLVGGPIGGDVPPATWISCVPNTAWTAVYIWDAPNQRWLHFFNTAAGTPAYVNNTSNGGITTIPRFSGVAVIMSQAVASAKFADSPSQGCT
jgi:hypothetical protein